MHTHKLVPFLRKLEYIAKNCPVEIGYWSIDGKQFNIVDFTQFGKIETCSFNKKFTKKTFIRQLYYYRFKIINDENNFIFSHPYFLRDFPDKIYCIKRVVKQEQEDEVGDKVDKVKIIKEQEIVIKQLSNKISELQQLLDVITNCQECQ
jgi:hypothetical protein